MNYNTPVIELTDQALLWRRTRLEQKVLTARARVYGKVAPAQSLKAEAAKWEARLKETVEEILRRGLDSPTTYDQSALGQS